MSEDAGSGERRAGNGGPSVAIVGLGLIGGSIARRVSESGWRVGWIDPAVDGEAVRAVSPQLNEIESAAMGDFDLVVLATPTGTAIELLRGMNAGSGVLTSVCSVMKPLTDIASERSIRFVAGHPMAGREVNGWENAIPTLFERRPWFTSAVGETADSEAAALVDRLIADCGAEPVSIDPEEHDRHAAVASHLPQLLSSALAALVGESDVPPPFLGPGLRTFLRLAGGSWSMWEPVFDANSDAVRDATERLDRLVGEVMSGRGEDVFTRANEVYREL